MCLVVNALFEFTLMLLFFKKIKIEKKNRKTKMNKGAKCEKKKVE
jgi:hypothetical protein